MASIFLARRTTMNISRASTKDHHPRNYIDSATRISTASFSTAHHERSEGLAEGGGGGGPAPGGPPVGMPSGSSTDPMGQATYEAKQQSVDPDEKTKTWAAQFVPDSVKEGVSKATEIADAVGDTAKKTMDSAWKAAKEGNQRIRETVVGNNNGNKHNYNNGSRCIKDSDFNVSSSSSSSGSNNGNGNAVESEGDPVADEMQGDPVADEMRKIDGPIDTVEYRSIDENILDMKKAGDPGDY